MHHNGSQWARSPNFASRMCWRVSRGGRQGRAAQGLQKRYQIRVLRAGQVWNQIDCTLTQAYSLAVLRLVAASVEI